MNLNDKLMMVLAMEDPVKDTSLVAALAYATGMIAATAMIHTDGKSVAAVINEHITAGLEYGTARIKQIAEAMIDETV
jgi:hypothetical protein